MTTATQLKHSTVAPVILALFSGALTPTSAADERVARLRELINCPLPQEAESVILRMTFESQPSDHEERALSLISTARASNDFRSVEPVRMILDMTNGGTLYCERDVWTQLSNSELSIAAPMNVNEVYDIVNERHPCNAIVLKNLG